MSTPYAKRTRRALESCTVLRVAGSLEAYEAAVENLERHARRQARYNFVSAINNRRSRWRKRCLREDEERERRIVAEGDR